MGNIKIVGINGSPRPKGNTYVLLNYVLEEIARCGIDVEIISLHDKNIEGCSACYECVAKPNERCCLKNDDFSVCFDSIINSHGFILGSPTYVAGITPKMKAFIDRATFVARANRGLLKHKLGAAIVVARRAGVMNAFDMINHMFLCSQMYVVGSSYWNVGFGKNIGDVEKDAESIQTMKDLGQNMAWLLKKIYAL